MNKVSNGVELVARCIDEGESIGGFVANGWHADGAKLKNIFKNAVLLEADIFDRAEINNVGGFREQRSHGHLDGAFVGDKKFVAKKSNGRDNADKNNGEVKHKN